MSFIQSGLDRITGADAAEDSARAARGDISAAADLARGAVDAGYGGVGRQGAYNIMEPLATLFGQYIQPYQQQVETGLDPSRASLAQLASMRQRFPGTPNLPRFNFDMESDPVYQFQQDQLEKTLNRQAASQGRLNSSDALNALASGTMDLAGRYGSDAFNRAVTGYGLDYGRGMDLYGADVNRSNTMFGRGQQMFQNQMGLADNQLNRFGGVTGQGIQGLLNLAQNQQNRANTLANIATGSGSQLADINMDIGGLQVATSPLNTAGSIASMVSQFVPGGGGFQPQGGQGGRR